MLTRLVLPLLLSGVGAVASASSLKETFGPGILGIPWGTSLTSLVGVYPQGDHMYAVTPGCRAYWVKDGQQFLGIPREGKGVLFGLDKQNHVAIAAVAFDFERKDELRTTLTSLFKIPKVSTRSGAMTQYGWRSSEGMIVSVTEFGEGPQRIIWLSVSVAGYGEAKEAC